MVDFGKPFLAYVFERGRRSDAKAHEEDVGLGVGQRSETIVILLTGCIEESQRVWLVTDPEEGGYKSVFSLSQGTYISLVSDAALPDSRTMDACTSTSMVH